MNTTELLNKETNTETTKENRTSKPLYTPATDLYSNEEEHVLRIDLPGVKESDLEISLEKNELRISAKTTVPEVQGELRYSEYRAGDYRRNFVLSESVEEDGISAVLKNGVLELKLPRKKPQTKKIEVKSA